jgi:hypothetical protein
MHSASSLGKIKDGLAWLEIPSWLVWHICLCVFYDLNSLKQWFSNFNMFKNHLNCKCVCLLIETDLAMG